jgi:hypothetical protein
VLARRLAPVTLVILLAQTFFLAGFFDERLLSVPLAIVTIAVLVTITAWDYRADVRQRDLVDDLRRQLVDVRAEARAREVRLADDMGRLTRTAIDAVATPTLLRAQLGVLAPVVVDLLATPSAARREQLREELEEAAVRACATLIDVNAGSGRAVLYRRVGRRFVPAWPQGSWLRSPAPVPGASAQAGELRSVLRRGRVVHSTEPGLGQRRCIVELPVALGRRWHGVLHAERSGAGPVSTDDLEAMEIVARLLAAGAARVDGGPGSPRAKISARARARWRRRGRSICWALPDARHTLTPIGARLESAVESLDSRAVVHAAASAGRR